ncbi:MAG: hypothetical protein A3A96_02405 [Candidatus Zambryskibacteria bacterium RIFCSPLOWO2_01_FULL_39_39]|uniref:Uncharacterized protein n=1 Tax=Candidatus Zambryskibacteria bacterium RIFCSPLOWO2_01_FULL_39_39 TaxID=1802758 RepID=A0A1G2TZV3_9BACT|nr:MAG: hypothetical protein UT00_C0010G0032 [Parcubacteria group bacterium GW2011_GWA1_38_7]OHA87165.1 MAG: hypothetical protein A2644_02120 [Candidatus Zambryskibacteria bacterium RIFCSPHIGHO2_01_FULL_39_63]OHA94803.1 MAG: hypothetical protein A3B88_04165 [Candidatus Zambryskibacteria bacterium RIFCSPHIGHO2_02_FULL_39_19]OHA98293.1 MAG: hypothetical protein A3F20_01855 [Candidatus Zambryskibacteria bacterium RIFCSPHIGHO2_12_FULL_39_21]OHB02679.1 MAG: hypothetical protein A3A96_02405 [Candidat
MKKFIAFASAAAFLVSAVPALAFGGFHFSSSDLDIDVDVDNDAYVKNDVDTTASTGGNTSTGGSARNRVSGGNVDNTEANGGDTGDIDTGDAFATTYVTNTVNSNDIVVRSDCGCRGEADLDVDVDNDATVKNYVDTKAKTGHNDSVGGNASNKVKSNSSHSYHHWFGGSNSVDNTEANGGDAGEITTGDADAYSDVVNVVNTNVVRVRR